MPNWNDLKGAADLGGGIGGTLGSVLGDLLGGGNREEQERLLREITASYGSLDPHISAAQESVVDAGPSAFDSVSLDPATRDAQLRALSSLMETGLSGGMDATSRSRVAGFQGANAAAESAARGALLQGAQSRGVAGSGLEYAAQLQNQQGAAQRNSQAGMEAAADAQQRALQALSQGGVLAGQVRGQDYGQAADKARAADIIAQHNAANRQGVYGRNADRTQNAAQATFGNQMARADGMAQGRRGEAGFQMSEEERKRRMGYGLGSAAGTAAGAAVGGG